MVLADGGICCIDEFNLMRESDRASIHEAMEQQTISMAKAGILCTLNTRCAIIAAANPKNLYSMSEPEGPSAINIGIGSPLLSRFDLVFILRDERDPEWDSEIADHLLAQVCSEFQEITIEKNSNLWTTHQLQMHFSAISNVHPKMSDDAKEIISAYYLRCRSDPQRDHGRTTIRLLDSLHRLAEAHARLVFRGEVTAVDAIVVIRLMESTFGFGRTVQPYDVIKQDLPLGPDNEEIDAVLKVLQLGPYNPDKKDNGNSPKTVSVASLVQSKRNNESDVPNASQTKQPQENASNASPPKRNQTKATTSTAPVYDPVELDRMFSFDDDKPADKAVADTILDNDEEDAILSQALDGIEQIPDSPPMKIRKVEVRKPNRLRLAFKKFQLKQNTQPKQCETLPENRDLPGPSSMINKTVKNRIFCTPNDSESSLICSNRVSLDKTAESNTQLPLLSMKIDEAVKPTSPDTEDSAYDTMMLSSNSSLASGFLAKKTQTKPPLFPPSAGEPMVEQDLSFLDTLEF